VKIERDPGRPALRRVSGEGVVIDSNGGTRPARPVRSCSERHGHRKRLRQLGYTMRVVTAAMPAGRRDSKPTRWASLGWVSNSNSQSNPPTVWRRVGTGTQLRANPRPPEPYGRYDLLAAPLSIYQRRARGGGPYAIVFTDGGALFRMTAAFTDHCASGVGQGGTKPQGRRRPLTSTEGGTTKATTKRVVAPSARESSPLLDGSTAYSGSVVVGLVGLGDPVGEVNADL